MKPLIVANWKMNPATLKGARLLFDSVKRGVKNIKNVEVVICPPFIYLSHFFCDRRKYGIKLGAQDCFWEEKGAFTGEVSPKMLKDLGCSYVILGHSERRALGETDEMINKKIKAVMKEKLKPILCIGETKRELGRRKNELGKAKKFIKNQLEKALKEIPNSLFQIPNSIIIAYEPVWAIGTGNPCQPAQAKEILIFLRKLKKGIPILYGGSVNSKNGASYIKEAGFDGLLVGGTSLDAKEFIQLIKNVNTGCW